MEKLQILGIEFGSTRIKAVLIDGCGNVIASGAHRWENQMRGGFWTYDIGEVIPGMRAAYAELKAEYKKRVGEILSEISGIGISGMMHGYLAFDKAGEQIGEFRTWRNTATSEAAAILTERLGFNIPQRWSCAHLYQSLLNKERGAAEVDFLTTLSGYVHYLLTGERVIGIGEGSGMFPIDTATGDFDASRMDIFDSLLGELGFKMRARDVFPRVLKAGASAGRLSERGALLIDPEGDLKSGILLAPPEGDMQTGMVATNSVKMGTGNISAGTSANACIIADRAIHGIYPEIDIITTPDGNPALLLHTNTCTAGIDAWAKLFMQAARAAGAEVELSDMISILFDSALEADADAGGIVAYSFMSGEPILGINRGLPMAFYEPDSNFSLQNMARAQLYAAIAVLRIGLDFLKEKEGISPSLLVGHGGFFKSERAGTRIMADAMKTPISTLKTAGEGGPFGMALLALYCAVGTELSLADFLDEKIFSSQEKSLTLPDAAGASGFDTYLSRYKKGLAAEISAAKQ